MKKVNENWRNPRCKILSLSDVEAVRDFAQNTSTSVAGVEIPQELRQYGEYLKENRELFKAFGIFTQGRLDAILLSALSTSQPSWYITAMYGREGLVTREDLIVLLDYTIAYYELNHYLVRFSSMYPANRVKTYQKLWDAEHLDYVAETDLLVQAGVKPPFNEIFVLLMSRMLWPQDMAVRTFIKRTPIHSL